jgi:PKD repeat protein
MTGSDVRVLVLRLPALALVLVAVLAAAVPASAQPSIEYHEGARFGGFDESAFHGRSLTPGKFMEPTGFAVDAQQENDVYVADRTSSVNSEPAHWRIQKLSSTGEVLATTKFTLPGALGEPSMIAGLAVDHAEHQGAGRLYALVIGPAESKKFHATATQAEELLAWSTESQACVSNCEAGAGGQLVAAQGLAPDPLASTGGLVSSEEQLEEGATPKERANKERSALYDPQGIVVDHLSKVAGVANPVAIEASNPTGLAVDENGEVINEAAPLGGVQLFELEEHGETIVQQVATQGSTGAKLTRWPPVAGEGQGEAGRLAREWGPLGIFADPGGSISILLSGRRASSYTHTTTADVVRLNAKLEEPLVVNNVTEDPPPQDHKLHIQGERRAIMGLDPGPFFSLTRGPFFPHEPFDELFELRNAGPEMARLGSGLYAADLRFEASPATIQEENEKRELPTWLSYDSHEWRKNSQNRKINVGIRLLEPNPETGKISGERGDSIVNTLGAQAKGSPCNIGAEQAALAVGSGDTLWVLDRGPAQSIVEERLGLRAGREIIELAPGGGETRACPQTTASGTTFRMGLCRPTQSAGPKLEVPAEAPVAFDASSVRLTPGSQFSYEWEIVELAGKKKREVLEAEAIEHRFEQGSYEVRLKVWSDYGSYPLQPVPVTVNPPQTNPEAQFSVSRPEGGLRATFDASASMAGTCDTIAHYLWNWGDGSAIEEDSTPIVTHAYAAPGEYAVTLTVVNSEYRTAPPKRQTVVVSAPEQPIIQGEPTLPPALSTGPPHAPLPGPRRGPTYVSPRASFLGGVLSVSVSCPTAKVSCVGTVEIQTAAAFPAGASSAAQGAGKRRARRLVLGAARFSLAAGHSGAVTVHLTSRGAALLRRLRRLPVLVVVSAHDPAGDPGVQSVRLVLTAPGAARHRATKHR